MPERTLKVKNFGIWLRSRSGRRITYKEFCELRHADACETALRTHSSKIPCLNLLYPHALPSPRFDGSGRSRDAAYVDSLHLRAQESTDPPLPLRVAKSALPSVFAAL
ncbi:hypothetical protein F5141DRAFT_245320 [Pisolithus sp. B1]|nr:hypothetical protein F5141DRAFT_245320 [Pisolithus sp. B1]